MGEFKLKYDPNQPRGSQPVGQFRYFRIERSGPHALTLTLGGPKLNGGPVAVIQGKATLGIYRQDDSLILLSSNWGTYYYIMCLLEAFLFKFYSDSVVATSKARSDTSAKFIYLQGICNDPFDLQHFPHQGNIGPDDTSIFVDTPQGKKYLSKSGLFDSP